MKPMFSLPSGWTNTAIAVLAACLTACGETTDAPPPRSTQAQSPFSGILPGVSVDEHALPLVTAGPDGVTAMEAVRDSLSQPLRSNFEQGFRLAYCADKSLRNYGEAVSRLAAVSQESNLPGVSRCLAWARYHTGQGLEGALPVYDSALAVDPEFGPAHYDLAFLMALTDPDRGRDHFQAAVRAGVEDVRNLEERFYPPR